MDNLTGSLFPYHYESNEVKTFDDNGYPTLTEYYRNDDKTDLRFSWVQEWNDKGVCTSHQTIKA